MFLLRNVISNEFINDDGEFGERIHAFEFETEEQALKWAKHAGLDSKIIAEAA